MQRGFRNQRGDSREIFFNQQLAYPGGGNRHLLEAQPLNFHQFNRWGGERWGLQPVAHVVVVLGGDGAIRFGTDEAVRDAKCRGQILAEDFQVYFGVAVVNDALLFNEVARERGARNDVFRSAMHG
ncbi:hypothetical protein D3C81_1877630 [compost metagenome]